METVTVEIAKIKMTLSPLKAIRKHCLKCGCGQFVEVQLCPAEDCALWPYRFGRGPEVKPQLTSLKSIKAMCLDCSSTAKAVTSCWNDTCVLYLYRQGHNPNLKGKRRGGDPDALRRWRERENEKKDTSTRRDSETRTDAAV